MKVIGIHRVQTLVGRADEIDAWVSAWAAELYGTSFGAANDLIQRFPKAEEVAMNSFVFPVLDTGLGVRVSFAFRRRVAVIKEVVEAGAL